MDEWGGTNLLDEESANFVIPLATGPDNEHVPISNKHSWNNWEIFEETYATGALDIHVLEPLRTKPPSTSVAVVSIPAGSEPWFGSVRPWVTL